MNVLVGFEESGTVREAFRLFGHNAWSCDLLESSIPSEFHIVGDIYEALHFMNWDIIILHPMCTALTVAGNSTYGLNRDGTPKEKHHLRVEAIKYTEKLWNDAVSVCGMVCLENPVGVLTTKSNLPKPQYVHPWQFGHKEQKKTALFLHGLPNLEGTFDVRVWMNLIRSSGS